MAKKDFSAAKNPVLNPAMRFITTATEPAAPPVLEPVPTPEPNREKKPAAAADAGERKSRRLNLLVQPSVLEDISRIATMRRTSVNDLINSVLKDYAQAEAETLARYVEAFGEE